MFIHVNGRTDKQTAEQGDLLLLLFLFIFILNTCLVAEKHECGSIFVRVFSFPRHVTLLKVQRDTTLALAHELVINKKGS